MFNVTRIEGHFVKNGEVAIPLDTYTYGQNVEPRQQRSFRFPIALAEDTPLGEYTLVAKIFYATRDKMPFVSPVCDEPTELVPALPKGDTAAMLMQAGIGGLVVLAVGALTMGGGKGGDAGKGGGKGGGRSRDGGSGGGGGGGGARARRGRVLGVAARYARWHRVDHSEEGQEEVDGRESERLHRAAAARRAPPLRAATWMMHDGDDSAQRTR